MEHDILLKAMEPLPFTMNSKPAIPQQDHHHQLQHERASHADTRDEELATTRQRVQRLPAGGLRLRSTAKITLDVATEIRSIDIRGFVASASPHTHPQSL